MTVSTSGTPVWTKPDSDKQIFENQKLFIDFLREEAIEAKKCITQYSFQCLALSGASIGIIISATTNEAPFASLSAASIIIILMIMSKITIYKYQVANRAYGYEMYIKSMMNINQENILSPSNKYSEKDIKSWLFLAKNEHWEKSFLTWKLITLGLLREFYRATQLLDGRWYRLIILGLSLVILILLPQFILLTILIPVACIAWPLVDPFKYAPKEDNFWISTNKNKKKLFSGTYLEHLLNMLTLMQILSLSPIAVAIIKIQNDPSKKDIIPKDYGFSDFFIINNVLEIIYQYRFIFLSIIFALLLHLIIARYIIIRQQITMLECGFYSIKTNFLIWKTVARINYESWLKATSSPSNPSIIEGMDFRLENNYDDDLRSCAELILKNFNEPRSWDFQRHLNS